MTVDGLTDFVAIDNFVQSLPRHHALNSSLASLSSRLANAYLVTRVIQCVPKRESHLHFWYSASDGWISSRIGHQ